MPGNIFWKLFTTVALVFLCIIQVLPIKDRPFEEYIVEHAATEDYENDDGEIVDISEFSDIIERAHQRVGTRVKDVFPGFERAG